MGGLGRARSRKYAAKAAATKATAPAAHGHQLNGPTISISPMMSRNCDGSTFSPSFTLRRLATKKVGNSMFPVISLPSCSQRAWSGAGWTLPLASVVSSISMVKYEPVSNAFEIESTSNSPSVSGAPSETVAASTPSRRSVHEIGSPTSVALGDERTFARTPSSCVSWTSSGAVGAAVGACAGTCGAATPALATIAAASNEEKPNFIATSALHGD